MPEKTLMMLRLISVRFFTYENSVHLAAVPRTARGKYLEYNEYN